MSVKFIIIVFIMSSNFAKLPPPSQITQMSISFKFVFLIVGILSYHGVSFTPITSKPFSRLLSGIHTSGIHLTSAPSFILQNTPSPSTSSGNEEDEDSKEEVKVNVEEEALRKFNDIVSMNGGTTRKEGSGKVREKRSGGEEREGVRSEATSRMLLVIGLASLVLRKFEVISCRFAPPD